MAFHSFLVWLVCGSLLTSQHFTWPISLNLGDQWHSALFRILLLKNSKMGLTNWQVQNMRKLSLRKIKSKLNWLPDGSRIWGNCYKTSLLCRLRAYSSWCNFTNNQNPPIQQKCPNIKPMMFFPALSDSLQQCIAIFSHFQPCSAISRHVQPFSDMFSNFQANWDISRYFQPFQGFQTPSSHFQPYPKRSAHFD